jgi:hypothetical protein
LAGETARIHIEAVAAGPERLAFDVRVENRAGHKLPTGYPSRRVWIHVRVRDGRDRIVFESGAFEPTGAITGNDADADGGRVEPHYETIRRAGEVQIYESAMVDPEGRVTTGLLIGVRYVKDNRLLPTGFDPGSASGDIAVRGGASADRDFTGGGDRVRYELEVEPDAPRPLHVEATLYYQPIAYRWAQNLRSYDASEPRRFVDMYDSMAATSAARLATAAHVVNPGTPAAGATGR